MGNEGYFAAFLGSFGITDISMVLKSDAVIESVYGIWITEYTSIENNGANQIAIDSFSCKIYEAAYEVQVIARLADVTTNTYVPRFVNRNGFIILEYTKTTD